MESCGSWVLGHSGAKCPTNTRLTETCLRRFQQWVRGKLEGILHALAEELHARGKLKLEEAFIDASFAGAKKGVSRSDPPGAAKERKSSLSPMITVFLSRVSIESASPHESQLVEGVLAHSFLHTLPARLIGDKACDSDRLDRDLAERYGIEMIAPHRGQRREPAQDGRPLRRYRRRWRVERLFAWLHHFRRLVIRWEYYVENFFGMVRLGCMQILLTYL
jgi:transposase